MINSLTPKSVPARTKKLSLGRLFGSLEQAHKHPHHDGAICPSSGMVLLVERIPPLGAYVEGVGQGRRQRILVESIN
jgi:hypothetical protein